MTEGSNDAGLLVGGNAGEEWEGEDGVGCALGDGEGEIGGAWVGAQKSELVDGSKVAGGCDAQLGEGLLESRAIERGVEADDVDEPTDGGVGNGEGWGLDGGEVGEEGVIALGGEAAEGEDFVEAGELDATESTGDVAKAVVEAGFGLGEPAFVFCAALIAEFACVGGESGVAEDENAAFTGGDLLVGVEAEDASVTVAADGAVGDGGPQSFAGVFDEEEGVTLADGSECGDVGWDAEGVNEDDGAGAGSNGGFDG